MACNLVLSEIPRNMNETVGDVGEAITDAEEWLAVLASAIVSHPTVLLVPRELFGMCVLVARRRSGQKTG